MASLSPAPPPAAPPPPEPHNHFAPPPPARPPDPAPPYGAPPPGQGGYGTFPPPVGPPSFGGGHPAAYQTAARQWQLRPRAGGAPIKLVPGQTYVLGRGSIADITISDPAISRQHARLSWAGPQLSIVDLGSRNGTAVNGQRLNPQQAVPLFEGDIISCGDTELVLSLA